MNESLTFDPLWEEMYRAGHVQRYPWDVVVSFVFRNLPKGRQRETVRILEVGCGSGSNLWFAAREGFTVAGVDASAAAIEQVRARFEADGLSADLRVADFTHLPFDSDSFDLAIDRGAIVCTGLSAGHRAVAEIQRVLKPGGRFFFNPYSDRHSSAVSGVDAGDGLRKHITAGTLVDTGQICFYSRPRVESALAQGWHVLSIKHVEVLDVTEPMYSCHAEWRVVAQKNAS